MSRSGSARRAPPSRSGRRAFAPAADACRPPHESKNGMYPVETVLVLLAAVAALATLARKLRVAYPILLVLGGLALGLVPGLPRVQLPPDVVFLVFIPPLVYLAGYFTTWRDFRANLRPIGLL